MDDLYRNINIAVELLKRDNNRSFRNEDDIVDGLRRILDCIAIERETVIQLINQREQSYHNSNSRVMRLRNKLQSLSDMQLRSLSLYLRLDQNVPRSIMINNLLSYQDEQLIYEWISSNQTFNRYIEDVDQDIVNSTPEIEQSGVEDEYIEEDYDYEYE